MNADPTNLSFAYKLDWVLLYSLGDSILSILIVLLCTIFAGLQSHKYKHKNFHKDYNNG